ncbi:DUF4174 domain-containing protein [Frigidibacter sp. MR17.24]|uniref:DUF4174 domain-containing protein n=1 Tax=Frigidibacter sp. MR17.24 TaxID=3127345 RepID=UPI003012C225
MPRPHALALASLLAAAIPGGIAAQALSPPVAEAAGDAAPGTATGPATDLATDPADRLIHPAADQRIEDFRWDHRLVVVFADTEQDPAFRQQMAWIAARPGDLITRDVIVLTDTAPDSPGPIRQGLRPRGFSVVLVDKDGIVNQRKPFPQELRELTRSIDRMPVRQEEIRRQRFGG